MRTALPGFPKGRVSAYSFFLADMISREKKQGKTEKASLSAKKAGGLWNKMNDEEKEPFIRRSEIDRERYDQ